MTPSSRGGITPAYDCTMKGVLFFPFATTVQVIIRDMSHVPVSLRLVRGPSRSLHLIRCYSHRRLTARSKHHYCDILVAPAQVAAAKADIMCKLAVVGG